MNRLKRLNIISCCLVMIISVMGLIAAPNVAHARTPAEADADCAATAAGNGGASGFAIFLAPLEISGNEIGDATFRTYVCNGTDHNLSRDFSMLQGNGDVQETGLSGAFDYGMTGWDWNSSEGFWMQDMGDFAPHTWRSKDVTIRVDGSKFNDTGWYTVAIRGKGRLWDATNGCNYPGYWYPPGCSGDTNVITIRLKINIVRPTITCEQVAFNPINPAIGSNFNVTSTFKVDNGSTTSASHPMDVTITPPTGAPITYSGVSYTPSPAKDTTFSYTTPDIVDTTGGTYSVQAKVRGPSWFTPVECNQSFHVADRPYLQVYQGDVITGGKFKDNINEDCDSAQPSGNGDIRTFSRNIGSRQIGSYSQYGAFARNDILDDGVPNLTGFTTAGSLAGSDAFTFANDVSPKGQFGVDHCIDNFYQRYDDGSSVSAGNTFDVSAISGRVVVKKSGTVTLTRSGNGPLFGKGAVLLVEGDVIIDSNIKLTNAGGLLSPNKDDLPYLYVVAKGGSIFINPGVSSIDGVYIAQPDSSMPNSGRIVTCRDSTPTDDDLYDTCRSQLRVNGSFVARRIEWKRVWGNVTDEAANQNDRLQNNSVIGNAAESINISPEVYYSLPKTVKRSYKYDSLRSLPPVF